MKMQLELVNSKVHRHRVFQGDFHVSLKRADLDACRIHRHIQILKLVLEIRPNVVGGRAVHRRVGRLLLHGLLQLEVVHVDGNDLDPTKDHAENYRQSHQRLKPRAAFFTPAPCTSHGTSRQTSAFPYKMLALRACTCGPSVEARFRQVTCPNGQTGGDWDESDELRGNVREEL